MPVVDSVVEVVQRIVTKRSQQLCAFDRSAGFVAPDSAFGKWCATAALPFAAKHRVLGRVFFNGHFWVIDGTKYYFKSATEVRDGFSDRYPALECIYVSVTTGDELFFQAYDCDTLMLMPSIHVQDIQYFLTD